MHRSYVVAWTVSMAAASVAGGATVFRGQDNNPAGFGALASFPNSVAAESSFLTAAVGTASEFGFETFEPGPVPGVWDFGGGLTATHTSEATQAHSILTGISGVDTYALDGAKYLHSETAPGSGFFSLTFSRELTAIGMYVVDASDWIGTTDVPGPLFVELFDAQDMLVGRHDVTAAIAPSDLRSGNVAYFGVIADAPFTKLRMAQPLRASGGTSLTDAIGIDKITAVPGPGAAAVVFVAGVLGVRRRR